MLQVVTFITLPSSSYSPSIFTHVRREISKVKKLPLPLSKYFLIYRVLHHWMTENRSPIYCKTQQRVSSNRLLSLLPMARVRLEFKRTVSDFKQVDPRCILYIPKYRAKCEQTLASTLENRDISYISANLFHDPRVFDFTSSFPFRNEGSQQSKETGAG